MPTRRRSGSDVYNREDIKYVYKNVNQLITQANPSFSTRDTPLHLRAIIRQQIPRSGLYRRRIDHILRRNLPNPLAQTPNIHASQSQQIRAQTRNMRRSHTRPRDGFRPVIEPCASDINARSEDIHESTVVRPGNKLIVNGSSADGTNSWLGCGRVILRIVTGVPRCDSEEYAGSY